MFDSLKTAIKAFIIRQLLDLVLEELEAGLTPEVEAILLAEINK